MDYPAASNHKVKRIYHAIISSGRFTSSSGRRSKFSQNLYAVSFYWKKFFF